MRCVCGERERDVGMLPTTSVNPWHNIPGEIDCCEIHALRSEVTHLRAHEVWLEAEIVDRADAEKRLMEDVNDLTKRVALLEAVKVMAQAVIDASHELELPAPDGFGWFPIVCKDRYMEALRTALSALESAMDPE